MAFWRLSAGAVAYRETTQPGSAIAEAQRSSESSCLFRSGEEDVPNWAIRQRAVVQGFFWKHQL